MPSPAEPVRRLSRRVLLALLVALAVAVNTLEGAVPNPLPVVRLGLANSIALLALLAWGPKEAFLLTVARVVLGALVAGGGFGPAFVLSLGGGLAGVSVMALLLSTGLFSTLGLSAGGSFTHTLTQFLLLLILIAGDGSVMRLAPPFLLLSIPAGILVGWLAGRVLPLLEGGMEAGRRAAGGRW